MPLVTTTAGPVELRGVGPRHAPPRPARHPRRTDQALAAAQVLGLTGTARVLAPSRPGYLGTPLSTGRTRVSRRMPWSPSSTSSRSSLRWCSAPSGGGMAAVALAAHHPTRVRGLVLWSAVTGPMRIWAGPLLHGPRLGIDRRGDGAARPAVPRLLVGRATHDPATVEAAMAIAETVFPDRPTPRRPRQRQPSGTLPSTHDSPPASRCPRSSSTAPRTATSPTPRPLGQPGRSARATGDRARDQPLDDDGRPSRSGSAARVPGRLRLVVAVRRLRTRSLDIGARLEPPRARSPRAPGGSHDQTNRLGRRRRDHPRCLDLPVRRWRPPFRAATVRRFHRRCRAVLDGALVTWLPGRAAPMVRELQGVGAAPADSGSASGACCSGSWQPAPTWRPSAATRTAPSTAPSRGSGSAPRSWPTSGAAYGQGARRSP